MRLAKIDRYLLVLAALFGLALVRGRSLPGEDVLPDLFGALVEGPLRAGVAGGESEAKRTEALESRVASQIREIAELRGQVDQARQLRKFFEAIEWPQRPRAVPAWVVGIEPDPWQLSFRIRVGADAGVRLDPEKGPHRLAVVHGAALLGVVDRIDNRRLCTVRRVDDDRFRIEVEIARKPRAAASEGPALPLDRADADRDGIVRGVAEGRGDETLVVRFVRLARELEPGLEVFTSAYDPDIPAGLLVGRIESVEDKENDGVREVRVVPAASFVRLGQVDVLIPARARDR